MTGSAAGGAALRERGGETGVPGAAPCGGRAGGLPARQVVGGRPAALPEASAAQAVLHLFLAIGGAQQSAGRRPRSPPGHVLAQVPGGVAIMTRF